MTASPLKSPPQSPSPHARAPSDGDQWFRRGFGRWVATCEYRMCKNMAGDVPGFYGVQLGGGGRRLMEASPVQHHLYMDRQQGDVRGDWRALPFAADSLDLVVLAHALDAAEAPQQVLRESVRALRPEGSLIIVGFNPFGALALSRSLPWREQWLSVARLKDWLALLDMHPVSGAYAAFLPPWELCRRKRSLRCLEHAGRRWWPMAGGVFALHTVKRRYGVRPIRPNFRKMPQTKGLVGAEKRVLTPAEDV